MQALWLEKRSLSLRTGLSLPQQPANEVLVRVRLAGICATDLELVRGYYPFTGIPGHEFVGEVSGPAPQGAPASLAAGQRVVGEINAACGQCDACRAGRPTHCERRTVLGILDRNGAFAEYLTLPAENLHPVPEALDDEMAVFTEPLAAALEIQQQVHIHPEDRVLVVGAGRLGQLIAQTLALSGCRLEVVARHAHQRRLLEEQHIACLAEEQVKEGKTDLVVEATGSPDGFKLARRAVRPRGTIVLKSTYKGEIQANFSSIVVDEINLIGSRCGPFDPALRLMASGLVNPRGLISDRFPLSRGVEAFERAAQPGVLKVLLKPGES